MPVERSAMLGAQLWVVRWTPCDGVTAADVEAALDDHLEWMLGLEAAGHVVASGPLTSGPGVAPGAGLTVLRTSTEQEAAVLAARDPFVVKGLRTFDVLGWKVMEGALTVRVSFGSGTYRIS
jgi:uncharacterized protein YciI